MIVEFTCSLCNKQIVQDLDETTDEEVEDDGNYLNPEDLNGPIELICRKCWNRETVHTD